MEMSTGTLKDRIAEAGRHYKAFRDAEELLAALEAAEQRAAAIEANIIALKAEEAEHKAMTEAAKNACTDATEAQKKAAEAAQNMGAVILAQAKDEARKIISDAKDKAAFSDLALKKSRELLEEKAKEHEALRVEGKRLEDVNNGLREQKKKILESLKE